MIKFVNHCSLFLLHNFLGKTAPGCYNLKDMKCIFHMDLYRKVSVCSTI